MQPTSSVEKSLDSTLLQGISLFFRYQQALSPDKVTQTVEALLKPSSPPDTAPEQEPLESVLNIIKGITLNDHIIESCKNLVTKARQNPQLIPSTKRQLGHIVFLLQQNKENELLTRMKATYVVWSFASCIEADVKKALAEVVKTFQAQVKEQEAHGIIDHTQFRTYQLPKLCAKLLTPYHDFFNVELIPDIIEAFNIQPGDHIRQVLEAYQKDASLRQLLGSREVILAAHLTPLASTEALIRKTRPHKFVQDLQEQLACGFISRKVGNTKEGFFARSRPDDAALDRAIAFDGKGALPQGGYFWNNSALQEAACSMGLSRDECRELLVNFIASKTVKLEFTTTPKEIIAYFTTHFPEEERKAKHLLGMYGFSSTIHNPLLQSWQDCLQQMAELRPRRLMEGKILNCLMTTLRGPFSATNLDEAAICHTLFLQCMQKIHEGLKISYDSSSSLSLYGVDSKEKFRQFILGSVDDFFKQVVADRKNNPDPLVFLYSRIQHFVAEGKFLQEACVNFHQENFPDFTGSQFLPWNAKFRTTDIDLASVYVEKERKALSTFKVETVEQFLEQLITAAKLPPQKELLPLEVSSSHYTALFLNSHPSFVQALKSGKTASEFVSDYKNAERASGALSQDGRNAIINWVKENIISPNSIKEFTTMMNKLDPSLSLEQFRNFILTISKARVATRHKETKETVDSLLDSFIISSVFNKDPAAVQKLQPIHIGNGFEIREGKQVHFCIFRHPFANRLVFGAISEDNTTLFPFNFEGGKLWIEGKEFQIFSTTEI